MKDRNYNIDFLRGIATICIIYIHTAFWSGEMYLPKWFTNISLIIDVPVFIWISGISFSYINSVSKVINGLVKQWKRWIFFIFIYTAILFVFFKDTFSLRDIPYWFVYAFPNSNALPVVGGSIWFVLMYIKVSIIGSIIISAYNYFIKDNKKKVKALLNTIIIIFVVFSYSNFTKEYFLVDERTLFYTAIYLLGYVTVNYKINIKQLIIYLVVDISLFILSCIPFGYTINSLQSIKFITPNYIFFSTLSILVFWYLKDHLKIKKNNIMNYVGQNALNFYYAQGVSSSLLYIIYPHIANLPIPIIFIIMLVSNITMTVIGAVILEKTFKITCKIISNITKKTLIPIEKDV